MNAFSALSDGTRREIVRLVAMEGGLGASEISQNFQMSSPAISQHLKVLREARILRMEKAAQRRIYTLDVAGMDEIETWILETRNLWKKRMDRLDAHLQRKKKERKDGKI
ncbi:MAG: transcriptional regulator [Leptospiraceae bacterium]|nr:transcriptional regulator [Leptospiraceae bacterium]